MKLYIVRHGETDWNKKRRIQGHVDIPLNDFGRSLARKTAKGLSGIPFEVCYTSPLGRAKETARLILEGRKTPILEDQRIIEMSFGDYEGKCCSKSNWELPEKFRRFFDDPVHYEAPCGGEDFIDVRERTGEFLKDICGRGQYQSSNILITTHGAALAGLLNNIRGEELSRYWGVGVHKNCAVTEVEVTDGIPRIISENVAYYDDEIEPWEE